MQGRHKKGMTLVEMLIAMAILGIVLLITSSGIIQSLQINRLSEDAANTQSKLRRITEVVSQELRSAVMGGITNFPYESNSTGISFTLLSGDGGLPVTGNNHAQRTEVFSSEPEALNELIGAPALIIEGSGRTRLVLEINDANGMVLHHDNCYIYDDYPVNTRLYSARMLGLQYDANSGTLYQTTLNQYGEQVVPFAYDLSRFEIAYEYDAGAGNTIIRDTPMPGSDDNFPSPVFTDGDKTYQLSRLRLTLASQAAGADVEREYVSYIELTGIGNDASAQQRTISSFIPCGTVAAAPPPGEEEPGHPGGPSDPGDPDDPDDGDSDPEPQPEPTPDPEPQPDCHWFLKLLRLCG